MLIAPEHDNGREAVMRGLVGVPEAKLERMLGRQEWHDVRSGELWPEIRHEMPKVVLLLRPHRAVRDHHPNVLSCERPYRMVSVDPGVDAFG